MKALISSIENIYDSNGEYVGQRVCDVSSNEFETHSSLFWIECSDNIKPNEYYYKDGEFFLIEEPSYFNALPLDSMIPTTKL